VAKNLYFLLDARRLSRIIQRQGEKGNVMAKGQGKPSEGKSEIVKALPGACTDEAAAVEFLEQQRWCGVPACPHCGDTDVYQMRDARTRQRSKRFLWRCHGCKRQFTVRVGTVFEDSRIPLRHWCYAFWAACASKKGVSALQIHRQTGVSYKSALFLMHRIRWAMKQPTNGKPLKGIVEADETYVGGKPKRGFGIAGRGTKKTPVVAVVERGGGVRVRAVTEVTSRNLGAHLFGNVERSARLITDEFLAYRGIGEAFGSGHDTVKHTAGEYARGDVHTNTVECFFSLLKRGLYGTFHSVSKRHLHRYLDEFAFRWDTRKMDDGERTGAAIRGAEGKRLLYREPTRN
jgi:transposase-like protein